MIAASQPRKVNSIDRKLVPLSRLKNAPHNPPGRMDPKKLRPLIDSLEKIGLLHPLTISMQFEIIDGHRRAAAARILEWKDIECNIVQEDAAEVYASVNTCARRMSGNDALSVWLINPHAVPDLMASKFLAMIQVIGRPIAQKMAKQGLSIRMYGIARSVAKGCDDTAPETVREITIWLMEMGQVGQVMKAMQRGESPHTILKAVKQNKPLVFKMVVGD